MPEMIAVGVVIAIHIAIAIVEMCLWDRPSIHSRLGFDRHTAKLVAPIVANAGLYNAFIASGLIWGQTRWGGSNSTLFFLACVIVAGVFGAVTLKWTTLLLQSLPGAIAFGCGWMSC